jgi:hypothetical protein
MKNIYILVLVIIISLSGCQDDFIKLSPEDQLSASTFYKTEAHFRQAVIAAYVPLRSLVENDTYTGEMRSDNTHYEIGVSRATNNTYREEIADFMDASNNTFTNNVYANCYSGISKANIVIGRIAESDLSPEIKAEIDGEAKFLRAFYYFKLVRYFGGVPLFTKEVKKAEDAFLPRSAVDEIYALIISDARDAISVLHAPASFPQSGSATKGSATMLLAEVYVTLKKYAEAEQLLNTLPAMGYTLNVNYADTFKPTNKNSRESLFEVQYKEGQDAASQPNDFVYLFLPKTANAILLTGIVSSNSAYGGWNTPTKDLIAAYEPNDKRLDASIGIAEGTYNASLNLVISANKSAVNYTPPAGKVGVPYIKKYMHAPHVAVRNTNENWPIYRYADALLLLAESLNEQNKSIATTPLNQVRFRAGLPDITETDQTILRQIIAKERRVELAFENHRWHDLVRTGMAIAVMNAYGIKLKQQYSYLNPASYNVTTSRLLYPIPESEIGLNPKITQNPGYH